LTEKEIFDIFDFEGKPLGVASREDVHQKGLWHRSFHCWIVFLSIAAEKCIVFQRRGPAKNDWPNYLDISSAGHYWAGEGVEGGLRELVEELGVRATPDQLRKQGTRTIDEVLPNGTINREFQDIYFLRRRIALSDYILDYAEVTEVCHLRIADVRDLLDKRRDRISTHGVAVNAETRKPIQKYRVVRRQDFIPNAFDYLRLILELADTFLDDEQEYFAFLENLGPRKSPVVLPDGSLWQPIPGGR